MSAVDSQLHLEWDTELDYVEFRENCLIVMDQVQWKNNITYEPDMTVNRAAERKILDDSDGGRIGAISLMPRDGSYTAWQDFMEYLLTCLWW